MKRTFVLILVVLVLAAGPWLAYQWGVALPLIGAKPSDADAPANQVDAAADAGPGGSQSGDAQRVVALGWIEPAEGVIDISALPGDRLESVGVQEGTAVQAGQPLAYLESRALRRHELEAVESQLNEAEARWDAESKLADARIIAATLAVEEAKMLELDIRAHQKKLEVLQANLQLARKDLQRIEGLSEELVSKQERERQALVVQQAEAEVSAAEAMLEKMERSRELSIQGAEAKLQAVEASKSQVLTAIPVKSLEKRRDLAKRQWEQTVIEAPCDGVILKVFAQSGETVGPTPILKMGCLDRMVVVAEVYETDVKHVRPGHRAVVSSRAFFPPHDRNGIRGKVARVGRIISKPELKSLDPLAPADRHVVEVRIELDEEGSRQAAKLANLQVDVTFLIEP